MKSRLLGAVCACLFAVVSQSAQAVAVSGQGTWESTLQGRDLDGNTSTFEAYYDTTLDITWLADANAVGTAMNWVDANAWVSGLNINGITGWRLPTTTPINGSSYNTSFTTNATSDTGYADSAGWLDGSGNPVSEMGHMFYVTLGDLGFCPPDGGDANPETCDSGGTTAWGLTNTGPFSNVQSGFQSGNYWSGSALDSYNAWGFRFSHGRQDINGQLGGHFAWAVRSGDVSAVPVPAAVWLFGSGLIGLLGLAKRRH